MASKPLDEHAREGASSTPPFPPATAQEPAESIVKLVALVCRPMPEPVRAGLHLTRPASEAALYIERGWARPWTEEDGLQHAHNGQPVTPPAA